MRIGILPLGRPTFDVAYAEVTLAAMLTDLDASGHDIVGPRILLMDAMANAEALALLAEAVPDVVLVLQVTFTDAAFVIQAANALAAPLAIWAPPEPRLGGRLRLNAFCGLNLAGHALGLNRREFSWLYASPRAPETSGLLDDLLAGRRRVQPLRKSRVAATGSVPPALRGLRIARLGEHPVGFDTCRYDGAALADLIGAEVDEYDLQDLFGRARAVAPGDVARLRAQTAAGLANLNEMDAAELDRSLRLKLALDALRAEGRYDAFAIRCWPEMFTEYGGAVCGPVAMLGEARVPCACEADVYGALSQILLQRTAQAPVFLADLVDMDTADDTGVVWHCGQAPLSMADPATETLATVHSNRKMALLYEFPLRAGRVTFFRVSQALGEPKAVIATGEMLSRPKSFTGTSGVVRFDAGAAAVLRDLMDAGLEHHMALTFGDHADALRSLAGGLGLPVLTLGETHV